MEPEGSLPHSQVQVPATCPIPDPDGSQLGGLGEVLTTPHR